MVKLKKILLSVVALALVLGCFSCSDAEPAKSEKVFEAGVYTAQNCEDIKDGAFAAYKYKKIVLKEGAIIKANFTLSFDITISGAGVIQNSDGYAIKIIGGTANIDGVKIDSHSGILIQDNDGSTVKNVTISASDGSGITISDSCNITVDNCQITSKNDNFNITASQSKNASKNITLTNNSLACDNGAIVNVCSTESAQIDGILFKNNTISSSKNVFFKLLNTAGEIKNIDVKDITVQDFSSNENIFIQLISNQNTIGVLFENILVNKINANAKIMLVGGQDPYKIEAVTFSKIMLQQTLLTENYPDFSRQNQTAFVVFINTTIDGVPETVTGATK